MRATLSELTISDDGIYSTYRAREIFVRQTAREVSEQQRRFHRIYPSVQLSMNQQEEWGSFPWRLASSQAVHITRPLYWASRITRYERLIDLATPWVLCDSEMEQYPCFLCLNGRLHYRNRKTTRSSAVIGAQEQIAVTHYIEPTEHFS